MKNYYYPMCLVVIAPFLTAITTSIADIDDGLVGHWSFDDEEDYAIVYDSSGNENHGITIGGTTRARGVSGEALAFDGVDDYVEIPHNPTLHSDRQITITGWFFLNEFPPGPGSAPLYDNYMALFWKGNRPDCTGEEYCGNREYGLWVHKERFMTFCSTPEGTNRQQCCRTSELVQLHRWHHFGAVINRDEGHMRVYLDGNLAGENTFYGSSNIRSTSGPLLFGGDTYDPTAWRYPFFDGLMDEVRIHQRALSQEEIRQLYENDWRKRCMFELPGDMNKDCMVNFQDLALMAANWSVNCNQTPDDPACTYVGPEIPEDTVFIPGGQFEMGDHFGVGPSRELPLHIVRVDSFAISKYETTNAQYAEYLNAAIARGEIKVVNGIVYAASDETSRFPYFNTSSAPLGAFEYGEHSMIDYSNDKFSVSARDGRSMAHHPVVMVSWYGAKAFCDFYGYRLPTEAEWEYAARGGDYYYKYPWGGNTASEALANCSWANPLNLLQYPFTSPAGYYGPQGGYGLSDMEGNVWEWCSDWQDDDYYSRSPEDNPTGPDTGAFRVFRGGAWTHDGEYHCRSAHRHGYIPTYRHYSVGFRFAMDHD